MNNGPFLPVSNVSVGDVLARELSRGTKVATKIAWIVVHIEKTKTLLTATLFCVKYNKFSYCNDYFAHDIFVLVKT